MTKMQWHQAPLWPFGIAIAASSTVGCLTKCGRSCRQRPLPYLPISRVVKGLPTLASAFVAHYALVRLVYGVEHFTL